MTDNTSSSVPSLDDVDVDCRHLSCPLPVLRLQKALAGRDDGARLTLLATDPVSVIDIPHFCRENGDRVVRHTSHPLERGGVAHLFEIVKGGQRDIG